MRDLFNNIQPGFGPFQALLTNWAGILIAAVWAGAFIWAAVALILSIANVLRARKQHRHDSEEVVAKVLWPLGVIAALVLIPVIYVAIYDSAASQIPPPAPAPTASPS
ncbi:MAG: hypothetical protein Q4D96_09220 [Propionibacteriaceae bacterium]|nr:hypothetical protein [Propionibacteriaceae bacterium]